MFFNIVSFFVRNICIIIKFFKKVLTIKKNTCIVTYISNELKNRDDIFINTKGGGKPESELDRRYINLLANK